MAKTTASYYRDLLGIVNSAAQAEKPNSVQ